MCGEDALALGSNFFDNIVIERDISDGESIEFPQTTRQDSISDVLDSLMGDAGALLKVECSQIGRVDGNFFNMMIENEGRADVE